MEWGIWPDIGLNTSNTPNEANEVTQEDVIRVSESQKQASLMGWQIKDDQQKNNQIAKFLEFLFSEVKNDTIWEIIVELCTKTDASWMWLTLALHELIAFFAPFFPHQIEQYGIHVVMPNLPTVFAMWEDNYISYIRTIRNQYPLIQQMDTDTIVALIIEMLVYFGYATVAEDKKEELLNAVKGKLG